MNKEEKLKQNQVKYQFQKLKKEERLMEKTLKTTIKVLKKVFFSLKMAKNSHFEIELLTLSLH